MILMRANPLQWPLEGVGPENRDFFGPWNGNELRASEIWTQKRWDLAEFVDEI